MRYRKDFNNEFAAEKVVPEVADLPKAILSVRNTGFYKVFPVVFMNLPAGRMEAS